jgi:hypothetical protein
MRRTVLREMHRRLEIARALKPSIRASRSTSAISSDWRSVNLSGAITASTWTVKSLERESDLEVVRG